MARVRESIFKDHTGKTRNPELNEVNLVKSTQKVNGEQDLNPTGASLRQGPRRVRWCVGLRRGRAWFNVPLAPFYGS